MTYLAKMLRRGFCSVLVNTSERKKREAGALERENRSVGSDLIFPSSQPPRVLPSATVGGLCGGERAKMCSVTTPINRKKNDTLVFNLLSPPPSRGQR